MPTYPEYNEDAPYGAPRSETPYGESVGKAASALIGLPSHLVGRALGVPSYQPGYGEKDVTPVGPAATPAYKPPGGVYPQSSTADDARESASPFMSKANTPYYIPSNRAAAEENYGQYKSREAARMAQASQPLQYPGAMSALSMTNARVADGGDPDAAEQRRINTARAGGAGWLGLFTSGASQRALNVRRQQAIAEGHLGVEQGRLGFDTSKYFGPGGERDIAGQKVGIEGRIADIHGRQQRAEEQRYAPDTWLKNRINALYAQNRPEEAAQLQREHTGKADTVHVIPGTTGGGFAVRNLGQPDEYSRWFPGMPETTKKP